MEKNKPTIEEIENELSRLKKKIKHRKCIGWVLIASVIVITTVIVITNTYVTVLKVSGNSMEKAIKNGDMVISISGDDLKKGDIVAFYNEESILIKRIIGSESDIIDINKQGVVTVNGENIEEKYVFNMTLEPCDINFPFEVPKDSFFVMGDNRMESYDSRMEAIGVVSKERIVGKVLVKVWPLNDFGAVK